MNKQDMTWDVFLSQLRKEYNIVKVLADKNDGLALLLLNIELNKLLVVKKFTDIIPVYEFLKNISATNLPLIYDTFFLNDCYVVLEEYIDGITVDEVLENGLFNLHGAKKVITEICNALDVIHKQGFVHRDIKPENIMISRDGVVKLIDFNASRQISSYATKDTINIGTIGYAPPEQFGISQSDARTDIYACGILLNVMLTGVHPSKKIIKGKAEKIIKKCTCVDPNSRYNSVEELKKDL